MSVIMPTVLRITLIDNFSAFGYQSQKKCQKCDDILTIFNSSIYIYISTPLVELELGSMVQQELQVLEHLYPDHADGLQTQLRQCFHQMDYYML